MTTPVWVAVAVDECFGIYAIDSAGRMFRSDRLDGGEWRPMPPPPPFAEEPYPLPEPEEPPA